MKVLGVLVIMALVVGAFTSIPNVSAIGIYGDADFTKSKGNSHLSFGSASGKVCGIELCGSKSMPQIKETKVNITTSTGDAKSEALHRALQGQEASVIIREYNDFKGIKNIEIVNSTEKIVSTFNAFANPDFLNSKTSSTVMKLQNEMTIEEKKQAQVEAARANYPNYIKNSYANLEHPIYVPKTIIVENTTSSKIIVENATSSKNIEQNNTNFSADLILSELGFDIDMSKIGACGPGTELIDGVCFITQIENDTVDWADFWDTKEDKEVVLEQIIMTNGTSTIPLVDDMVEGDEGIDVIIEETIVVPSFEESTLGSNSTSIDIESIPVPEILEEVDTTVVVDGKTFKDQASADRFLALTAPKVVVPEPVVEATQMVPAPGFEDVPEMIVESENNAPVESNPRTQTQDSDSSELPELKFGGGFDNSGTP